MTIEFKYDVKQHEVLKTAALYSYRKKDSNDIDVNNPPQGYKLVKESLPSETGFYACVLKKGDEVIIAYRGTDDLTSKDLNNDLQIAFKKSLDQAKEAKKFALEVIDEFPNCKIFTTGHSLGGALAQIVGSFF